MSRRNDKRGSLDLKRALLIIPTYNEARNIAALVERLLSLPLHESGWTLDLLVRDDNSPDGTSQIVRQLIKRHGKRIILSQGKKEGLGKALQHSFDEALGLNYDVILTMDADFSHSPEDVPKLLSAIDKGADVAIGSRYVEGGLIPGNWPVMLIVRTRIASMVARILGGINPNIRELTTNFRAMRRQVLQDISYNEVKATGYGFQIYLANAFGSGAFKIKEVPISFHSRAHGESKAKASDIVEFFQIAYNLNDDSPAKQVMRFLAVGMSGTVVNLLALWFLRNYFGSDALIISFMAIQISVLWNFVWHNIFTFKYYKEAVKPKRSIGLYIKNYFKYQGATLLTQIVTLTSYAVFTNLGIFYLLAQAAGIATAVVVSYYISSRYIWSRTRNYA
ncbi:MAG: glycosyltransferase [Patescibacteria group bacterium]|nr:glycosyltransferase [Patescibacteria group bacterium]